ncbi:dihydroxyacetone kinase subunit DhaK [Aurantiacibacter xanthus]|uniref:Dihydroxyacetone kinase subunit DhaK n=1 Tax=Aurantiacibacter xanthus TaxID=1784712 RepID=A0A3A1P3R8_9SPHN|nr:dihydroxyacetone kinase subunit DhaL [Aurantiacibacter xanthus]RIV80062.1 dihydroxyacetone kinase subunit DhaK [Aurantiacibacter xanthus]
MKKLINSPRDVVPDMLRGLCATDERLRLIPSLNVIVRSDYEAVRERGEVALISGGGAGHEPAHAGYVGAGMLTAAVTGAVFTSPSVDAVLGAIRLVTGEAGCLLIVKNYTGDRLNFGLAASIARSEGLQVEMVLVDDDVALDVGRSRAGARGLAGTVFVHKLAGAAAAAGKPLAEVAAMAAQFVGGIGTMGVALSSCTNPSAGKPGFELGADEIEYGLGIHGERGASRETIAEASAIADRLIDRIVAELKLAGGERVALMVNGLGGTPPSELAIMAGGALAAARRHGLAVERVSCGTLLSALEMAGCSLTLARIDDERLALLDQPVEAPAWVGLTCPAASAYELGEPQARLAKGQGDLVALSQAQQDLLRSTIAGVAKALIAAEPGLTDLDSIVGDGDLGISLARGSEAVLEGIDAVDCTHPARAANDLSTIVRRAVGGTSGPLYAAFLLAAAQSMREASSPASLADWAQAMASGAAAITELGGAKRGDSTMLDAIIPAAEAMQEAAAAGSSTSEMLARALAAARAGTQSTADINPRVGRASYVGDRAVGHIDPGAQAVTVWLEAIGNLVP